MTDLEKTMICQLITFFLDRNYEFYYFRIKIY